MLGGMDVWYDAKHGIDWVVWMVDWFAGIDDRMVGLH